MSADSDVLDFSRCNPHLDSLSGRLPKPTDQKERDEDESCLAFGYLRGLHDRALAVELRFRNGNSEWFPYSWLGPWRYDPSVGLLLKFTGDMVTLVLIRGSNLDALVNQSGVNLTDRGLQRHRVVWIREMDQDELRKAKQGEPTIDRIEVAELESQEEGRGWLKQVAPVFVRELRISAGRAL